jgi:thermitase
MRPLILAPLAAILALTLWMAGSRPLQAEEIVCQSALSNVTVDNLRVPPNQTCTLTNVRAEGTVKVETNATLEATDVVIIGNLQADGATLVKVFGASHIGGSIQIKQGRAAEIDSAKVNADIQLESNLGPLVVLGNEVGGNVQVFQNREGGATISNNTIDGNLQCKENNPAPVGSGNVVKGSAEDQCASLTGGGGDDGGGGDGGGGDGGGGDGGGDDGGGDDGDDDDCDDEDELDDDACLFVAGQVVIKLNPESGATINDINTTYGTTTLRMLLGSAGIYLLQTPNGVDVTTLAAQMDGDARLLYAEPNFYGESPEGGGRGKWAWGGDEPSLVGTQYATTMLNLGEAHTLSRGDQIVVAVLDTGFQLDHPQLANRWTAARYDFIDDDGVPNEAFTTLDRNGDGIVDESAGHGTHVAGIVALTAPDAQIMPVRVLNASGRGNVFLVAEAVLYATRNGAHVINMSLGTTRPSRLLNEVIEEAITLGDVVVVAAAGNLNSSQQQYPASTNGVIAVTAVTESRLRARFANYGSWVDIAAPGEWVLSAFPLNTYAFWDGTSMAAPFVAGQAALLRSVDSDLRAGDVESHILATADPLTTGLGAGLINLVESLLAAGAIPDDNVDANDVQRPLVLTVQAYLPMVTR